MRSRGALCARSRIPHPGVLAGQPLVILTFLNREATVYGTILRSWHGRNSSPQLTPLTRSRKLRFGTGSVMPLVAAGHAPAKESASVPVSAKESTSEPEVLDPALQPLTDGITKVTEVRQLC